MSSDNISYMEGLPRRGAAIIGMTTRDIFLTKGVFFVIGVLFIPSLISIMTLASPLEDFKQWWNLFILFGIIMYLQLLLLILSLIYGTSIAHKEIENRTMTYLIIRGAKRAEVYIFRYIGTVIALAIMFTISIMITYGILMTHGSFFQMYNRADVLLALLISTYLGILVYTAFFAFIGTVFRMPLMVGLLFAFFWEVIMVNLPFTIADFTVMLYIRSFFHSNDSVSNLLDMGNASEPLKSIIIILIMTLIFLSIGSFMISRKDIH
jgi:ABC-type transport system involved in multi-copper enzyme maturation permease subunit